MLGLKTKSPDWLPYSKLHNNTMIDHTISGVLGI